MTAALSEVQLQNTGSDRDWAFALYAAFARGGGDEKMYYTQVEGEPWSKSRPKFSRRGAFVKTYQPTDDRDAEARLRTALRHTAPAPFPGNVMLACRFYRSNWQRIDTDNLIKHVCDAANGVLWEDDSQVTLIVGEVLYDADYPRTVILAGNHGSSLLRGDDRKLVCAHCGEDYVPPSATSRTRRFCSQACSHAARTTALTPKPCPECGEEFKPATKTQKLCSRRCVAARLTGSSKARAKPRSTCEVCSKQLAHHRGGRCRDCWRADPGFYEQQLDLS